MSNSPAPDPDLRFPTYGADPLPPTTEPELRELDARLRERYRRMPLPPGLVDRVYEASVPGLPVPALAPPARRRAVGWGARVAMAAALGLAFVVAALSLRSGTPGGGTVAIQGVPSVTMPSQDDFAWLATGPLERLDDRVAHLLDAGDLRSVRAITAELEALVADVDSGS